MIDQNFCTLLEHKISKFFSLSIDEGVKTFWCDGVLLPTFEKYYSPKFVNDNRKITMTAFIGRTGQDKYELTLIFGSKALSKYTRGLDISDCIPNPENGNCFEIDINRQTMSLLLG